MLTLRYINGFDVESGGAPSQIRRKFLEHIPTPPFTSSGEQGTIIPGYVSGNGWRIFNTGFREINYAAPLGAVFQRVVFRCYLQSANSGAFSDTDFWNPVLWLRFENGANGMQLGLRWTTDGKFQVIRGGAGRNGTGTVIGLVDHVFHEGTYYDFEMRVDFGTAGALQIWVDNVRLYNDQNLNTGTGCDRVTLRWESFGFIGMGFDHVAIATDDTAGSDRLGSCRVVTMPLIADYRLSPTWTPNADTAHFSRLTEVNPIVSPDDDTSYLAADMDADPDYFAVNRPDCFGYNFGVALNIGSKVNSGNPALQGRLLDGATEHNVGSPLILESARYAIQQGIIEDDPRDGLAWSDRRIAQVAWGFQPHTLGNGDMRVTMAYLEKLTSIAGVLPFDCGRGSYVF